MSLDELVLDSGAQRLVVCPARGGMVTAWSRGGTPLLYLDRETLADETKNVRGGIPVLFPSPGKLAGDAWARGDRHGSMKQHGFARNRPWRVVGVLGGPAPAVQLELTSSPETLAQFPWPCSLSITYALHDTALRMAMRVTNLGDTPMPFGLGFHPYFAVPQADKAATRLASDARTVFDNVTKQRGPRPPALDLAGGEVDLHLLDHAARAISIASPTRKIEITGSPAFSHWVVWSVPGKDFICLEPWTSPGDALNTGDKLQTLAPGATFDAWLAIQG